MKDRIKANMDKYNSLKAYKKEHGVDPWRATGQTTRALFDLASRYPNGKFIFITHNKPMADLCFRQFLEMQITSQAPVSRINRNAMCIEIGDAEYYFKVDSDYLRKDIRPTTTIIEDHMVGYERSLKRNAQRRWDIEQENMKEEHRPQDYRTTRNW